MVRCYNKKHKDWKRYGAKGCYVEEDLQTFEAFLAYMGLRPEGTTLDRIDPLGGYVRGNMKWSDLYTQNNNRRTSRKYKVGEVSLTMAEWVRKTGAHYHAVRWRVIECGWPMERALRVPVKWGRNQHSKKVA